LAKRKEKKKTSFIVPIPEVENLQELDEYKPIGLWVVGIKSYLRS